MLSAELCKEYLINRPGESGKEVIGPGIGDSSRGFGSQRPVGGQMPGMLLKVDSFGSLDEGTVFNFGSRSDSPAYLHTPSDSANVWSEETDVFKNCEIFTPATFIPEGSISFPSATRVEFTPFLEKLGEASSSLMLQKMLELIAKYFHDKIHVLKGNKPMHLAEHDLSTKNSSLEAKRNSEPSVDPDSRQLQVFCYISHSAGLETNLVHDFLKEADLILENREDLKITLRGVLPPSLITSNLGKIRSHVSYSGSKAAHPDGVSSWSKWPSDDKNPADIRKRKSSGGLAAFPGTSDSRNHLIGQHSSDMFGPREFPKNYEDVHTIPVGFTGEDSLTQTGAANSGFSRKMLSGDLPSGLYHRKRKDGSRKEGTRDENKRAAKAKLLSEKAKEENDLVSLGVENIDRMLASLQQQIKNVKHKHRKGTICPRCTADQKYKVASKAKLKAQNETKARILQEAMSQEPIINQVSSTPLGTDIATGSGSTLFENKFAQ